MAALTAARMAVQMVALMDLMMDDLMVASMDFLKAAMMVAVTVAKLEQLRDWKWEIVVERTAVKSEHLSSNTEIQFHHQLRNSQCLHQTQTLRRQQKSFRL